MSERSLLFTIPTGATDVKKFFQSLIDRPGVGEELFSQQDGCDSTKTMMETDRDQYATPVAIHNQDGQGPVLIVCEHASNHIPQAFGSLGLPPELVASHIAWDPGALAVAQHLSTAFDAPLLAGTLSRLLYDCNRPPSASDAITPRSEGHDIPGNQNLGDKERAARVRDIHDPFRDGLARTLARFAAPPIIVTVHSFTPVYLGVIRDVEIGLIHDSDDRLARTMLACAASHTDLTVALNDPYGPEDGVTHTLRDFALPIGAINVMLEIRNDLLVDTKNQTEIAGMLAHWICVACADLNAPLPLKAEL